MHPTVVLSRAAEQNMPLPPSMLALAPRATTTAAASGPEAALISALGTHRVVGAGVPCPEIRREGGCGVLPWESGAPKPILQHEAPGRWGLGGALAQESLEPPPVRVPRQTEC